MTYISTHSAARPARRTRPGFGLGRLLDAWRSRQHLKSLDDRALKDIGISRAEAEAEASRPIWDVPATWRD